eukprot:TRINITY_DN17977_c0_g1_i1.p1 TRINITY_DN17977_c0_g1~~TRINITY_DN17977_c0_g1_i1.p1  ORF type:complete len:106 (+),score=26.61 TRINITY_DN17977_c0_g1_i1:119-436(+)
MLRSLVGSEMCIRDRNYGNRDEGDNSGDELDEVKSSSSEESRVRRQNDEDEEMIGDEPTIQRMLLQEMEGFEEQQYCDEFFQRRSSSRVAKELDGTRQPFSSSKC